MPVTRKYRRETSEISGCLKYIIFVVNIIFWVSLLRKPAKKKSYLLMYIILAYWDLGISYRNMGMDGKRCFYQFLQSH